MIWGLDGLARELGDEEDHEAAIELVVPRRFIMEGMSLFGEPSVGRPDGRVAGGGSLSNTRFKLGRTAPLPLIAIG